MAGGKVKILVAPLDWGLGHATRCVPVIREFLAHGAEVEIAVVKANASFFRETFPKLRQRIAPGYNVEYPDHGYNMGLWLLKNGARLNAIMRYEHRYAEEMVARHHYDILFSDNRFAFYSKKAHNVYMTHQRRIAFPPVFSSFEGVGVRWHDARIAHFDEVWVPDVKEFPGYAGTLSHVDSCSRPVRFVGPLSRFGESHAALKGSEKDLDVVAVISGVEPSRTRFEDRLRRVLQKIPGRHVMILGQPSVPYSSWTEGNIEFHTHLPTDRFAEMIARSKRVVSRGGYSTVMDMAVLGASCIFVPIPGQYEQVVLAKNLSAAGYAVEIPEDKLGEESLRKALSAEGRVLPLFRQELLRGTVDDLFQNIGK